MNEANRPPLKRLDILFLSVFGIGFLPYAPGTWGTLITLPILYAVGTLHAPFFIFIPFIVVTTIIASFVAEYVQNEFKLHDPSFIVIDEVLGMSVAWLFSINHSLIELLILFALFRFFDIVKIWPASYFDKKVQHGFGTIFDDIISGLYAGALYYAIHSFLKIF